MNKSKKITTELAASFRYSAYIAVDLYCSELFEAGFRSHYRLDVMTGYRLQGGVIITPLHGVF
ncbi:MAG: hypothetical protein CMK32_07930 [Porticoccaceae bacterium]|nr:hypothetical protein [Porticoccaceae bacterium]